MAVGIHFLKVFIPVLESDKNKKKTHLPTNFLPVLTLVPGSFTPQNRLSTPQNTTVSVYIVESILINQTQVSTNLDDFLQMVTRAKNFTTPCW